MALSGRFLRYFPQKNLFSRSYCLRIPERKSKDGTVLDYKSSSSFNTYGLVDDVNEVKALGTIVRIEMRKRANEKMMASITMSTTTTYQVDNALKYERTYIPVQVFGTSLVKRTSRLKVGERIYVQGFLSYYKIASTQFEMCSLVAQKLIYMGVGQKVDQVSDNKTDLDADREDQEDDVK